MPRPRWKILDSCVVTYADEAAAVVYRLRRKHGRDFDVEVSSTPRTVRARCAYVDVWMVVARKPWKGEA